MRKNGKIAEKVAIDYARGQSPLAYVGTDDRGGLQTTSYCAFDSFS